MSEEHTSDAEYDCPACNGSGDSGRTSRDEDNRPLPCSTCGGRGTLDECPAQAAMAPRAALPEGWQAVPVEPTPEMMSAAAQTPGVKAIDSAARMHQLRGYPLNPAAFTDGPALAQAYRAMLAAAPAPPGAAPAQPTVEDFVRDLLWNEHPECCGCPVIGAEYMGQQEEICCGNPEPSMLNAAQIVASLRARFPERISVPDTERQGQQ